MNMQNQINHALMDIFKGIETLKDCFNNKRQFTIDGRLVGDLGEVIAEMHYDITIDDISRNTHDATTSSGRRVQIKATFKDKLTFKGGYDLYLGLQLNRDGSFTEIFNGPGNLIAERYSHRKGIGSTLLSFPISELLKLQKNVHKRNRIPLRDKSSTY